MAMSLTSSVKYLPINKAGIGSGIVNASRYVGQAIGMALLVTILIVMSILLKHKLRKQRISKLKNGFYQQT